MASSAPLAKMSFPQKTTSFTQPLCPANLFNKSHVSKLHTKEQVSYDPAHTFVPSGDQLQRIKLALGRSESIPKMFCKAY